MLKGTKFFKYLILIIIIEIISCFKYPINKKLIDAELGEISSIEVGTKAEFDQYVMSNEYVISIFHADWCGHCKRFLPVFDEASRYKILNKKWVFLKMDCARNSHVCMNNGIDQFPNSEIYRNHEIVDADLPNDLVPLLELLYKLSTEPLIEIKTKEEFFKNYGYYSPIIEVDKLPDKKAKKENKSGR